MLKEKKEDDILDYIFCIEYLLDKIKKKVKVE